MSDTLDARLQSPFTALVVGPTGCGKTDLLMSLIENARRVANPPPIGIDYCYGVWQDRFGQMKGVNFHRGMVDVESRYPTGGGNRWLIIDDLADELVGSKELDRLFTKHSHHLNLSVFLVTHNLFQKNLRQVSLNSHYMFLFYNPRDVSTVQSLARQLYPNNTRFLTKAYEEATSKPFSHLFIDLKQKTDPRARVRAGFAGDGKGMIALSPVSRRGGRR